MTGRQASASAVVAVAMLVAGCGGGATLPLAGSSPGDPAGAGDRPGPTSGQHLLLSDGRLYAEELDGGRGACFWFLSASGAVVSLRWPPGWTASTDPLAVRDPSGRTVARLFDEGLGFRGHYEAGRTGCAPGRLSRSFVVSSVEQAGVAARD